MPDRNEKNPGNVAGRMYVDSTCVDCDMCRVTAPDFFKRNEEVGLSIVFRQPNTEEGLKLALEAMEGCPSASIGDNGSEE